MAEVKKISILDVMSKYRKEHGDGAISLLSESTISNIETTSTGILSLDMLIGGKVAKGFPRGGVVELYGPEASMKTTTALYAIKQCQIETGKVCAILDAEQAFDRSLAEKIGVDFTKLVFAQPETTEETFTLAEELIATGDIGMLLIDSVAAMLPLSELEGDFGDSKMGKQALLMSQGLRKIKGIVKRTNTCLVFINQTREKIGVMYGNPETTTGGNSLKFYALLRIRCSSSTLKDKAELGRTVTYKLIKTKISASASSKTVTVPYFYEQGFDKAVELAALACEKELIVRKGAWYSDPESDIKIGQGMESVVQFIKDNPEYEKSLFNRTFEIVEENVGV